MSPRHKFEPGEDSLLVPNKVTTERRWGLPVAVASSALLTATAITASTLMLISFESREHVASKDRQVVDYVKWFMGQFTSVDPFHANDYVTRIMNQSTGDFAKHYHEKANEILLQVARAEPATGTVLDVGVERWNDDGGATVLVATEVTSKSPDEKQVIEKTNRWAATVMQEGKQWKISSLLQVI
jgi:Mce-associated membrane protein